MWLTNEDMATPSSAPFEPMRSSKHLVMKGLMGNWPGASINSIPPQQRQPNQSLSHSLWYSHGYQFHKVAPSDVLRCRNYHLQHVGCCMAISV